MNPKQEAMMEEAIASAELAGAIIPHQTEDWRDTAIGEPAINHLAEIIIDDTSVRSQRIRKIKNAVMKIIASEIEKARNKLKMDYLLAFGNYVPLGGEDSEPEVMAKRVTEVWREVARQEVVGEIDGAEVIFGLREGDAFKQMSIGEALTRISELKKKGLADKK